MDRGDLERILRGIWKKLEVLMGVREKTAINRLL